jgi:hypothetical protein
VIFEINDALALRLDQTGTLNMDDETITILYQKHIMDSTSGVSDYTFLYSLLKKAKRHLHDNMPTMPSIDQATTIGSFGADLESYYLQMVTIGHAFRTNRRAISSFPRCRRSELKWTVLLIVLIVWP